MQWGRGRPADARRTAGSRQTAHHPSLAPMLSAPAASGSRVCPSEKVCQHASFSCIHIHLAEGLTACGLISAQPNLLTPRQAVARLMCSCNVLATVLWCGLAVSH